MRHTGFAIAQTTNKNGSRMSTAKAFLRPVKYRKNLTILLNSTVTKVLINKTTKQAYGIELLNNGKKDTIYASKEIIISGGDDTNGILRKCLIFWLQVLLTRHNYFCFLVLDQKRTYNKLAFLSSTIYQVLARICTITSPFSSTSTSTTATPPH